MFPTAIASIFDADSAVARTPLSFDRVRVWGATNTNTGTSTSTSEAAGSSDTVSLFVALPVELLHYFVPFFSRADWETISLVDKSCRQWARSVQFRSVALDSRDVSLELLARLAREAKEILEHQNLHSTKIISSTITTTDDGNDDDDKENTAPHPADSTKPPGPLFSTGNLIGLCIRRLTITTPPGLIQTKNPAALARVFPFSQTARERCIMAAKESERNYLKVLMAVIRWALPNLQVLDWRCRLVVDGAEEVVSLLKGVKRLKHLRLGCVLVEPGRGLVADCGGPFEQRLGLDETLNLETLVVNVAWPDDKQGADGGDDDAYYGCYLQRRSKLIPFLETLIAPCAPSIVNLAIKETNIDVHTTTNLFDLALGESRDEFAPQDKPPASYYNPYLALPAMPNLRSFTLDTLSFDNLDAFLGQDSGCASSKLHSLVVDGALARNRAYLGRCGLVPSLQHLYYLNGSPPRNDRLASLVNMLNQLSLTEVNPELDLDIDDINEDPNDLLLYFLLSNNQLATFCTSHPLPVQFIDSNLLPILSTSFHNLTSLRLIFDGSNTNHNISSPKELIPESALQHLATIGTLKHLWLSAGRQFGTRHTWLPDHESIADSLLWLTPVSAQTLVSSPTPSYSFLPNAQNTSKRVPSPLSLSLESLTFTRDTYPPAQSHPLYAIPPAAGGEAVIASQHHRGDHPSQQHHFANTTLLASLNAPASMYYESRIFPKDGQFADYLTEDELRDGFQGGHYQRKLLVDKAWERWHVERMAELVKEVYLGLKEGGKGEDRERRRRRMLPRLESCYLGQVAIEVGYAKRGDTYANAQTTSRDEAVPKRRWAIENEFVEIEQLGA